MAAPVGSRPRANLERTAVIAVGVSPPTIARAAQLKGSVVAVREPTRDELARAERHASLFADAVDEIFDQTPGPAAGRAL